MSAQSTHNVYTVPNQTNIGINVTIQYIPKPGDAVKSSPDRFQVLFHNKASPEEQIQSSLNRWVGIIQSGELRRMTENSLSEAERSRSGVNFGESRNVIDRANGFRNCIPSNTKFNSKNENTLSNLQEILRTHSDKITHNPNTLVDMDTKSSIFNIESLFGSPTGKKNNKCEKQNEKYDSINLGKNEYSPSFINKSLSELSKSFHISKPTPLQFHTRSVGFNNQSMELPLSNDRLNKPVNFILKDSFLNEGSTDQLDQNRKNHNSALQINGTEFTDQNKVKKYAREKIDKDTANQANKRLKCDVVSSRTSICSPNMAEPVVLKKPDNQQFFRLFNLFEKYYLEGVYSRETLLTFNEREQLIFLKIIKVNTKDIPTYLENQQLMVEHADKYFTHDTKRKGYKITNNKRFIFRKIRSILYKNIQDAKTNTKGSKKARDAKFFLYYFQNAEEFTHLSTKERLNLKSLLRTYEESKIGVIWKFSQFCQDFSSVFFDFPNQMIDGYYNKKLNSLKFYLEFLVDKDDDYIMGSPIPIKSLPRPLTAIKQYMVDFYNSFGEHLKKSN